MTKKTLFLHIGHLKTGTSALQRFCNAHRSELASLGICFPVSGSGQRRCGNHLVLALGLSHARGKDVPPWYVRAMTNHPTEYDHRTQWARVIDEIESSACDTVLLSSEFFFALGFGEQAPLLFQDLASMTDRFDIHILCYLRRPDRMIESFYNQLVKTGHAVRRLYNDANRYHETPFLDYSGTLRNWLGAFGSDRIHVRSYERLQDRDIVSDVFSVIDRPEIRALRALNTDRGINLRIPNALIELKRLANNQVKDPLETRRLDHAIHRLSTEFSLPPDARVTVISKSDREFLRQRTQELNREIHDLFPLTVEHPFFELDSGADVAMGDAITDAEAAERYAGLLAFQLALEGVRRHRKRVHAERSLTRTREHAKPSG